MKRRSLLKTLGVAAGFAAARNAFNLDSFAQTPAASPAPSPSGPFVLPPLPYAYDALEPYIDATTMHLHHDKHHAAYVEKLNAAVQGHPDLAGKSVDDLVSNLNAVPEEIRTVIRNQGGGHANHSFWWTILQKNAGSQPKAELAKDLNAQFGSFGAFQGQFAKSAATVFGSGWAWLTLSHDGHLQIENSANQDSPLSGGHTPVLGIDVWEHAYYLKYQNRRPEYVSAFFNVVNWDFVSDHYAQAKSSLHA